MQAPPIARLGAAGRSDGALRDGAACALLAVFAALLLRATLLRGGAMLGFDLFSYFYPGKVFAAQSLRRGELPLWNPDVFFGAPFLANIQMAVLYPPDLIFLAAEFPRAVALSQWLHLTLASSGMFLLCRCGWRLGVLPALAAGLAFAGGGFFAAHMGHLNQVHAGAWLPWLALVYSALAARLSTLGLTDRRTLLNAGAPFVAAGGGVVALLVTAGHTQEAYFSLVAAGMLAAGATVLPPAWAPRRWPHLVALALIALNGALLAAGQLVPTVELMGQSYRQGGMTLADATAFGVERTYLLEALLPTFWHLPGQEVTGYVGTTTLTLALGALASPARRTVVSLLALALLAVTLTLGAYTPLFPLLHRWLPFFDSFRAPGRWLLVSSFALAGLAAYGLHALRWHAAAGTRERVTRVYALAVGAIAGGALLFTARSEAVHAIHWLPHARVAVLWLGAALGTAALALAGVTLRARWPAALLVGGLALELTYAAREMEYNQPGPPDLYDTPPAIAAFLERQSERAGPPPRTLSLAAEERLDGARLRRALPAAEGEARRYDAMKEVLRPNLGVVYGLPSPDGYDGGLLPLRSYADFKALLVSDEAPVPHYTLAPQAPAQPSNRLLGALNVRFLALDGRQGPPGAGWDEIEAAPGAVWLYENQRVLARAFVVSDVRAEPDPRRALALLRGLDLANSAVVERPVVGLPDGASRAAPAAQVVSFSATDMTVDATGPGLLVITESFYPGWRAAIDGADAPLVRANLHFRAVPLAAGAHRVRVWYDPLSVKLGFALSALTVTGNVAALVYLRWRHHRAS